MAGHTKHTSRSSRDTIGSDGIPDDQATEGVPMDRKQPDLPIQGGRTTRTGGSGSVVDECLKYNKAWAKRFNKPMALGVHRKLAVLTCMDSRLPPEEFLGLKIGDAEVIRNGGGRVTADVLRSMVICQDVLGCDSVMVIHHTDCGGQAVVRYHGEVLNTLDHHFNHYAATPLRLLWRAGWALSWAVPTVVREAVLAVAVRPIKNLYGSVEEDVKLLRSAPTIKPTTKLYGAVYSVDTGEVTLLCKDEGGGLVITEEYTKARGHGGPDKVGIAGKSSDAQPAGT